MLDIVENAKDPITKPAYCVESRDRAFEVKFLVDSDAAGRIRSWARQVLSADPHGSGRYGDEYLTTSLYFDTADFAVFRRHGSYRRSKYRIRRYGASDEVFLERKMRTRKVLSKRRTRVPCEELGRLALGDADRNWEGAWFLRRIRIRRIAPVIQVSYRRSARVAETALGAIRLLVDDSLRAIPAAGLVFRPGSGSIVIPDRAIVELKFRVAMPAIFKGLVEQFVLEPRRISKYRMAALALGVVPLQPGHSIPEPDEKDAALCLTSWKY